MGMNQVLTTTTSNVSTSLAPRSFSLKGPETSAAELRTQFTQFVGETFYGQMIKAMRSTVDKPAYFHGGRGEEVFEGQLDQKLAEYMTEASAEKFADPMFEQQFPHLANSEKTNTDRSVSQSLNQLSQLPRR